MADKKVKWSGIDTLIVIVVIAAVAVLALMFGPKVGESTEKSKVEFTVMLASKEPELADAITEGAKATISLTEKDGGVVKAVRSEKAEQMTFNSIDGTYSHTEAEGKVDIYVTIEANCDINEKYIKTGDTAIKVGAEIPVRGKGFAAMGFVVGINDTEVAE